MGAPREHAVRELGGAQLTALPTHRRATISRRSSGSEPGHGRSMLGILPRDWGTRPGR